MSRLALPVLVVFLGCSSELEVVVGGGSAAGGGGADDSVTSSSSGAGGAGAGGAGVQEECSQLALVDPVLTIEGEPSIAFDDYVRFAASSDDSRQVTATLLRQLSGQPTVVHHATLSPWEQWPSSGDLAPQHSTLIAVDGTQAPGRAPGGHFAFSAGQPDGVAFYSGLDPHADGGGSQKPISIEGIDAEFTVARSPGLSGPTHLVGTYTSSPGEILGTVVTEGEAALPSVSLGCSTGQPASGDAIAFGDGWIAAVSSGSAMAPGCAPEIPGSPTRIDVLFIGPDASISLIASIATPIVIRTAVAPHPLGAYITWLQSAPGEAAMRAARVEMAKGLVAGPVDVDLPDELPGSMVAAAVGRRLAVARSRSKQGAPYSLVVSVLDEDLSFKAAAVRDLPPWWGPTSAIGSPDGYGLLVGWIETGKQPWQARVARFDCGP